MKPKENLARSERKRDALVLIDVINDFDFPRAEALLGYALPAAERIATLEERARRSQIPITYANDNFGRWRSDFRQQIEHCLKEGRRVTCFWSDSKSSV